MTRRHCVLQLLALEPLTIRELYAITGWPPVLVRGVVGYMVANGLIRHSGSWGGVYSL